MKRLLPKVPYLFVLLVLVISILTSCSRKPLVSVSNESLPVFLDDLERQSLQDAVAKNLEYLRTQNQDKQVTIADKTYPVSRLAGSLEFFQAILAENPSDKALDILIRDNFDIFQATGREGFNLGRNMLVTGYFQPVFEGSLTKKEPFIYPLYSVPSDLVQKKTVQGTTRVGRMVNNKLVPYWTRKELDTQSRAAGHEIVWLRDPFDAFVLHIQGSGLIRLQEGSIRGIHYAAKNGHPYKSIGKHLVDSGRMKLSEASLQSIRDYITSHPGERDEILHHNPSYIFFNWTKTRGAIGNLGQDLTAGRSIAVDQGCFPPGAIGFLVSRKPVVTQGRKTGWAPLNRFVLVQDTGSAIRGPGRVDLFWGTGPEAGNQAGQMKEPGHLYFFMLKDKSFRNQT